MKLGQIGQLQIDPYNLNLKKKKNPHQIKLYAWLKFWSLSEIIFKMKRERKKKNSWAEEVLERCFFLGFGNMFLLVLSWENMVRE